jgi:GNAT superfamily N-acetyltransferase
MELRLEAFAGNPDEAVLVAEERGVVAGWIHVGVVRSLESVPFVEIRGLVVTGARRGRGIGGALVAEAEAWARRAGFTRMRVRSREARADAHRFYEARGYANVKTQRVFDKRLDD